MESTFWPERDPSGQWHATPNAERKLRPAERRVHVIVDESPDPRTRPPRVWAPTERIDLVDELAALGHEDDAAIAAWVEEHGFVGMRANARECRRASRRSALRWRTLAKPETCSI